jgi:hypothetical protein
MRSALLFGRISDPADGALSRCRGDYRHIDPRRGGRTRFGYRPERLADGPRHAMVADAQVPPEAW